MKMFNKALISISLFFNCGWIMGFLNFKKKRGEASSDVDLDIPPEPPKMMSEDISAEGAIDEELMPFKRSTAKKAKVKIKKEKMKLPELPPLPEVEEEPKMGEFPPLPEIEEEPMESELPELPPLPTEETELPMMPTLPPVEKKRKLFSFMKKKEKAPELLQAEELPELPSFPEVEEEVHVEPPEEIFAPKLPEMPVMTEVPEVEVPKKSVARRKFVTLDGFRHIQSIINESKGNLRGVDALFSDLEQIKISMNKEYSGLHSNLRDIQRKIMFVDKILFEEA